MHFRLCCLVLLFWLIDVSAVAEESHWLSMTVDNDILLGYDNGYTNGVYFSWFSAGDEEELFTPDWMLTPISWSLDLQAAQTTLQAYTLGQTMVTPEDITLADPPLNDIPYSGSLLFSDMFISIEASQADAIGVVVGVVGPSSGAESTQKRVHELVGSEEPMGWHTQLQDEIVVQLSRARLWRSWASPDDHMDFLVLGEAGAGNLTSFFASGILVRYGSELTNSFATPLLINNRSANPAAIEGDWYLYAGVRFEYVFNSIYLDGNTFRDSRSIDYDPLQTGLTAGFAYSWRDLSLTFALYDSSISDISSEETTRFGALTFGWKY